MTASQKKVAEKSVAKVPNLAKSESVAENADIFKTASQKTEVGSAISGAAVSGGLRGFAQDTVQPRFLELRFLEVFMVLSQDRVQQRLLEVYKVLPQDRVQQRVVALNIAITAVFSQDSAHQRFVEQNIMTAKALSPNRVQQLVVVFTFAKLLKALHCTAQSRRRTRRRRTRTWFGDWLDLR